MAAVAPPTFRFALWYVFAIGSLGALHPFLAVALAREGFSSVAVSGLLALFPAGLLASGPLFAALADRSGRTGPWLRGAALGAAASALMLVFADGLLAVGIAIAAFALLRAPLFPLVDALVVGGLGKDQARYGQLRLWGSVAFIAALQGVGALIERWPRAPQIGAAIAMVACAMLAYTLPEPPKDAAFALRASGKLARAPTLAALWPVAVLLGLATSTYDFFFAVHLQALGGSATLAALAMGAGVAIEVGVMAMAPRLVGRFGGRAMVRTAAFVAAVRFALTACFDDPYAVAAIQALHGVSFGAFWVGSMALVAERAPPNQRASATALLMATTAGIGPLLAMPLAALLLPVRGGQALFAVAAVASTIAFLASTKITHDATQLPRHEIA